ncbi:hypothetical protein C8Q79DRAFT_943966 [Trametes meyenii]|nr:hypothetical protein C8Q79DRAFT_943966 [Trametes meyenii]
MSAKQKTLLVFFVTRSKHSTASATTPNMDFSREQKRTCRQQFIERMGSPSCRHKNPEWLWPPYWAARTIGHTLNLLLIQVII